MRGNPFKTIFYILLFTVISAGIVYLLNKSTLDAANRPLDTITPENYNDTVKNNIQIGDTVQITGTPNLLYQIEQINNAISTGTNQSGDDKIPQYYYVGLKEYNFDFVVRILPGKLFAKPQTFTGKAVGLAQTEFSTRIKNSLNKPISFEESINKDASAELDDEAKSQISEKSKATFSNATLLVMDGDIIDTNQTHLNIIFWTIVLSIFLITLFRKRVFSLS